MDETGDGDRVLAGAVRAQARVGDVGRAADARVEDDIDVGTTEDGVDVGRDRRPEADVEPARLAEIQTVLGRVVDDAAAEFEPRPGEPGLDDDPPGMARRPDRGPDPIHLTSTRPARPGRPRSVAGRW